MDDDLSATTATIFATGWNALLARPPKLTSFTQEIVIAPPRALSLRLRPLSLKVISFTFPEAPAWLFAPPESSLPSRPSVDAARPTQNPTRMKPPYYTIKLEDRLYYLLQPPLETILASSEVHLPFEPFPYQYQGVAFLYPRYAAVLADEMGLGKTMQAITTIRLLLRAAELRA